MLVEFVCEIILETIFVDIENTAEMAIDPTTGNTYIATGRFIYVVHNRYTVHLLHTGDAPIRKIALLPNKG